MICRLTLAAIALGAGLYGLWWLYGLIPCVPMAGGGCSFTLGTMG